MQVETESSKVEQILEEISRLNPQQKEIILEHLHKDVQRIADLERRINSYRGIGRGVWGMDAQEYINELRSDDRL